MHDAERANTNDDGSSSGLSEVLDYAQETLGCAAVRYLPNEAVGFFSLTPRGVVSRWDDARDGAEILRRALGVTQLESACLVANASAKAHGETADGLVVALGVDEQQTARLSTQLQRLAPLVARAFLDDEAEEQRREEQLGQRLIIDLCRDIQDERLDEPSNDANIFEKGARHVCELFASSSCVILDVSDLRLFRGGGGGTASKTSSNTRSARSRMSTASTSVVDPSSSAGSLPTSPLTEQNGGDGRMPRHRRSRSSQELLSTMAMERQLDRTTDALIEMQEDDEEAEADGAAEGDDAMDDILASSPSDDLLTFESFVPAPSSQVVCSFPTTGGAVAVLGSHGPDAQALVSMPGDRVRPALARYLAASRNSGRDSRAYIEVGPFDGEGGGDDFDAPSSLRKMLGLGQERGLMCAAIMEADSQPASVVVVLLADGFDPRPYHGIFLEQVGACLIYSVVRARAEERDVAQSHFIQRVQHELRTPVHAILGVNETARYALGHSLEQAAAAGEGAAAVSAALREELCELVDSVALSADKLSTIVDDLVDFSLMVEGKKPSLVMGSEQVKAAAQGPTSVTTITWDTVCAVISSTVNQAWSLFRRECMSRRPSLSPPPLPELIFSTNYLHQDPLEWSVADVRMDLEVVKRVVWKLVLNAMQATETGLISVAVHRRALKIDSPSTVQKLELVVSDTGRGMARDFVDSRLFQPFAKERTESDGVGLSLSVCRSLVAQQGGRIYAQSTEGQGSKFIVSIPFTPRLFDGSKSTNKDAWSKRRGSDSASTGSTPSSHSSSAKVHFADFDSYSLALLRDRLVSQFGLRNHVTDDLGSANIIVLADVRPEAVRRRIIEGRQTMAVSPVRVVYMPLAYQDVSAEEQGFLNQLRAACGGSGDDGGLGNVHVLPRPLTFAHLRRFDAICHASVSPSPRLTAVKELTDAGHHPAMKKPRMAYSSSSSSLSMPPSSSSSSVRSLLVLVVEDNPLNAKILTTLLRRAGLEYIEAKDGRQAVELFERHRPRVVLLDINMPIMNGFEACRAMRRLQEAWGRPNEAHTIIAVTALSSEADKLRGQEAGVDEWHTKPLRLGGLVAKLQRWKDSEARTEEDKWPSPSPPLAQADREETPLSPL